MTPFRVFFMWGFFVLIEACQPQAAHHLEKAQQALYEKKLQEALSEYRQAMALLERNDSRRATALRAQALKGAADIYYLELRDLPKAAALYRELAAKCPTAPETIEGRILLADILRNSFKDVPGAIRELAQAIAQSPPQRAQLRYRMAKWYFEIGNYLQSEMEAAAVLESDPQSPYADDALFLRGQALSMVEGKRALAMQVFQQLHDNMPESPLRGHALFEKGKLWEAQADPEKAIEVWVQALALHPDPNMIQQVIARARRRLHATTPDFVGEKAQAFGHHEKELPQEVPAPILIAPPAKSSVEAAGGSALEALEEREGKTTF